MCNAFLYFLLCFFKKYAGHDYNLAYNPFMHCDQQYENDWLKGIIRVKEGNNLVGEIRAKGLYFL